MESAEETLAKAHVALRQKRWNTAEHLARQALRESPVTPAALCVLASVHSDRGDDVEALRLLKQAIACDNKFSPAYKALAYRYCTLNLESETADLYRAWAHADRDNPEARHMAIATAGAEATDIFSEDYVREHFNEFADTFDDTLVKKLEYRGHEISASLLARYTATTDLLDLLDAGCGTGLCGPLLRPNSKSLFGVDLSKEMIEHARLRKCYDRLLVSELSTFMESSPASFDGIVSSDVLHYFGELARPTSAAYRALRPGGIFIFSVEALNRSDTDPYRLQRSGRFAYCESYLRRLLATAGFEILTLELAPLRWERSNEIVCHSVACRKP